MTRSLACLIAAAVLTAGVPAFADPPSVATASPATALSPTDTFLVTAAGANEFEIESSKLAQTKTSSEHIKQFAGEMVNDHTLAATKMKQAVNDAKLKAPPETPDPKLAAVLTDLQHKEGADFDKAYVDAQYQAHVAAVTLFENYAQSGDNPRIKKFATEMLPTLRLHLDHVKKLKVSTGAT